MRKCPFCSEEIQDDAIKCKHCGSDVRGTVQVQNIPCKNCPKGVMIEHVKKVRDTSVGGSFMTLGIILIFIVFLIMKYFGLFEYSRASELYLRAFFEAYPWVNTMRQVGIWTFFIGLVLLPFLKKKILGWKCSQCGYFLEKETDSNMTGVTGKPDLVIKTNDLPIQREKPAGPFKVVMLLLAGILFLFIVCVIIVITN